MYGLKNLGAGKQDNQIKLYCHGFGINAKPGSDQHCSGEGYLAFVAFLVNQAVNPHHIPMRSILIRNIYEQHGYTITLITA